MGKRGKYVFSSATAADAQCKEENLQLCKKEEVIAGAKGNEKYQNVCSSGWTTDAGRGWYSVKGSEGCGDDNTWNTYAPPNGTGSAHCCKPFSAPAAPAAGGKYMGCGWNQPANASDQSFFTKTQKNPTGKAGGCSSILTKNDKGDNVCLNPNLKGSDRNTEWNPKIVKGKVYLKECQDLMNKIGPSEPSSQPPAGPSYPVAPAAPTPHNTGQNGWFPKINIRSNVYNNMQYHRYHRYFSSDLDHRSISREKYEEIGRRFIKEESDIKGVSTPPILDSEAEVLGRMVWRVFIAEIEEKRSQSPKAKENVMEQETELLNKVSNIMKNETDNHMGKKHQGLGCQASDVPDNGPKYYPSKRTDNMFGCRPNDGNNVKRKKGYAFEGHPVSGLPRYYDQSSAIEHCFKDHRCGGVNYNSTTGEYSLMPKHSRLIKKKNFTAFIKKDYHNRHQGGQRYHWRDGYDNDSSNTSYQPITGIGSPVDPNSFPRPYDSLMDLFS